MTTSFLMTQMPNRKGNIGKPPKSNTGVTAVTGNGRAVSQPNGSQGAPKASGNIYPSSGKAQVSRPKADYCANDGYRSSSFK